MKIAYLISLFLGPVMVNILLFHVTRVPEGLLPGVIATVLCFLISIAVRSAFAGVSVSEIPVRQTSYATGNR